MKRVWLLLYSFVLISFSANATQITLDKHFEHILNIPFEYSQQPLTIEQAKLAPTQQWQQLPEQSLNLGLTNQAVWLRLQ